MGIITEEFRNICGEFLMELRKPPGYPLPNTIRQLSKLSEEKALIKECDLAFVMNDFLGERAEGQPDYCGRRMFDAVVVFGYYIHELLSGEPLETVLPKIELAFGNLF